MPDEIERTTIRLVARRLLPLVFLLYLLSLIDRVNLGFAALTMNKELGLTSGSFSGGLYYVARVTVVAAGIFFALRGVTRAATAPAE